MRQPSVRFLQGLVFFLELIDPFREPAVLRHDSILLEQGNGLGGYSVRDL